MCPKKNSKRRYISSQPGKVIFYIPIFVNVAVFVVVVVVVARVCACACVFGCFRLRIILDNTILLFNLPKLSNNSQSTVLFSFPLNPLISGIYDFTLTDDRANNVAYWKDELVDKLDFPAAKVNRVDMVPTVNHTLLDKCTKYLDRSWLESLVYVHVNRTINYS